MVRVTIGEEVSNLGAQLNGMRGLEERIKDLVSNLFDRLVCDSNQVMSIHKLLEAVDALVSDGIVDTADSARGEFQCLTKATEELSQYISKKINLCNTDFFSYLLITSTISVIENDFRRVVRNVIRKDHDFEGFGLLLRLHKV